MWTDTYDGTLEEPPAISGGRILLPLSSGLSVVGFGPVATDSLAAGNQLTLLAGEAVIAQVAKTPPPDARTWVVNNSLLPPGLLLSATGTVSGTPTTPGRYQFTVQVTDPNGARPVTNVPITVTVLTAP